MATFRDRPSLPTLVALVAVISGCGAIEEAARDESIRSLAVAASRSVEELEGQMRLVVPETADPDLARVLISLGSIPATDLADQNLIPPDHALFEGLILDGARAEFGLRVGPFDRTGMRREMRCGTKYRLSFERAGERWLLTQLIKGGC